MCFCKLREFQVTPSRGDPNGDFGIGLIEVFSPPSRTCVNIDKWKRFTHRDISEIELVGTWEYLDLSVLDD